MDSHSKKTVMDRQDKTNTLFYDVKYSHGFNFIVKQCPEKDKYQKDWIQNGKSLISIQISNTIAMKRIFDKGTMYKNPIRHELVANK